MEVVTPVHRDPGHGPVRRYSPVVYTSVGCAEKEDEGRLRVPTSPPTFVTCVVNRVERTDRGGRSFRDRF